MKELSIDEKIRRIVEHFKQDDPLGIPGVPIPDPKEIPDIEKDITGAKVILTDAKMHDMSKFRIDYVRTDLKDLKVKKFRPFFFHLRQNPYSQGWRANCGPPAICGPLELSEFVHGVARDVICGPRCHLRPATSFLVARLCFVGVPTRGLEDA